MRKCLATALCLLAFPVARAAAQDRPAEYIEVITVTVRPGAVADYEDFIKKVIAGAAKIGAAPQVVLVHQPALGGPGYTYEIVIPFEKWSDLDGFTPVAQVLSKAYGDIQAAAVMKAGRAAVERSQTAVYRLLRSLSSPHVAGSAFVQLIVTQVDPEMTPSYEMYLAKVKSALDQAPGAPPTLRWVSVEGPAATYVTAQFFNKWSERDSAPNAGEAMRKAYGEVEARQLLEASQRAIRNRVFYVSAFRSDLSRLPAPAK